MNNEYNFINDKAIIIDENCNCTQTEYYDKLYMDILKEEFDERGKTYIKNKNIK